MQFKQQKLHVKKKNPNLEKFFLIKQFKVS